MAKQSNTRVLLPILFAFFVMGFCDIVGIATSYMKSDFCLSETVSGFIPSMVFIWFFFLSIPFASLMNRTGRKKLLQASNIITIVGMLIPLVNYSFTSCMIAFILLGIGNTMIQVSLNPLLAGVVRGESLSSALTAGQVIKAVSSFSGPLIAALASTTLGNWKYLFPIYAAITLLSLIWLQSVKIPEPVVYSEGKSMRESVGESFSLLKDKRVLLCFFGIFAIVGVDVGTNALSAKLMIEKAGWAVEKAGLAASYYFICRTIGALLGSFLLVKMNERKFFICNMAAALAGVVLLIFSKGATAALVGIGMVGFFCASIFAVIVSMAMAARPDKTNEISGFMITGVVGGAVVPPLMGIAADLSGGLSGSLAVLALCIVYLLVLAFAMKPAG